jgi:hypothetical protein
MELLEPLVGSGIPERVDVQLCIENVFAGRASHCSAFGGVISIPGIARVPSMSSR